MGHQTQFKISPLNPYHVLQDLHAYSLALPSPIPNADFSTLLYSVDEAKLITKEESKANTTTVVCNISQVRCICLYQPYSNNWMP